MKRSFRSLAVLALCAPLLGWAAWPEKPIRMVVPYAAGGGADNTARIVAQHMSATLGQPIVIDNKPGAGGVIGADAVAKAPADGYTVLYDASAFSVNPSLRKLPFDAARDFIPVSLVATAPQILVVPPDAPYRTVAEFLAFARRNPGRSRPAVYFFMPSSSRACTRCCCTTGSILSASAFTSASPAPDFVFVSSFSVATWSATPAFFT
jgi:tripartite-type tricarboxylate transporter receptor subunit TctC